MPSPTPHQPPYPPGPAVGLLLPLPEQTALELARLGAGLPGADNPGRACLRTVARLLDADPPDLLGAALNARLGVLGAFTPATATATDERPEFHLLAACLRLLAGPHDPAVSLPARPELLPDDARPMRWAAAGAAGPTTGAAPTS